MQRLRNRRERSWKEEVRRRTLGLESLERREVFSADPLPVLMVIADQQDFYYREYGDTRIALEAEGLSVQVAATTTNPSHPHSGTGEGADGGVVTPDIALEEVDASDYSAIVFVGGWGSSMYQYAFTGDYYNNHYDGNVATKAVVNDLINDFVDQDKFVTAICHGVTVLAWARVDGVSPLNGKQVSVPHIGSPGVYYNGQSYGYFELMQYPQIVANGGIANSVSGQYGDPLTVDDDVVVDGKIITAENFDSATAFGETIAAQLLADVPPADPVEPVDPVDPPADPPPVNQTPVIQAQQLVLAENSAANMQVGQVVAADPDAGQALSFAITAGNASGAFAIDSATGVIHVANPAALDFEANPVFNLTVRATDNGAPAAFAEAVVTVSLSDVFEPTPGSVHLQGADALVYGTPNGDTIYAWTGAGGRAFVWLNGQQTGPLNLGPGGVVRVFAGDGNDRVYATDLHTPAAIYGEGGHDVMTGGHAGDIIDGGAGWDRAYGMGGNDVLLGGADNDWLDGGDGNDVVVGGEGDDKAIGGGGRNLLIGGLGTDCLMGGAGEDLLIGGTTSYDNNAAALAALLGEWSQNTSLAQRRLNLTTGLNSGQRLAFGETVFEDGVLNGLYGGDGADLLFATALDNLYGAIGDEVEAG